MSQKDLRADADQALDCNLDVYLDIWRNDGWSFDRIARHLAVKYGVEVTGRTVSNWHHSNLDQKAAS